MKEKIFYFIISLECIIWATGKRCMHITRSLRITFPNKPPQEYKHYVIRHYAKKYHCNKLIETGTYLGDTLFRLRKKFAELYSVEVVEDIYNNNQARFENINNVHLYLGDSALRLKDMIKDANTQDSILCFWLDGHYSGGITGMGGDKSCPIYEELNTIFTMLQNKKFVILIDDAGDFNGTAYPDIDEVKKYIENIGKGEYDIQVKSDIIRVVSRQ
ncbi:MAG: hypothetical protein K2J99_17870 [Lachnospiraceae bacterium]|nr:hypothetical protein [Lachnospiraceae bacterium]